MRILSILLILLIFACKNKKEAASEKEPTKVEQVEPKPSMDEKSSKEEVKKKIEFPDNALARIQRTACFGRCPIYKLTVFNNGTVKLKAEKWLEQEGAFTATVDSENFDRLMQRAAEVGYFDMANVYDSESVTDLPSTITTLRRGDELKQIVNRYQGPEELNDFEKYFDELYLKLDWKEIE